MDDEACDSRADVHVHVGQSSGHIFYDQRHHSTSTIPRTTPPLTSDTTTVPASSPRPDQDPGMRDVGVASGGPGCPWTLAALPGQRISLRIIIIDPPDYPVMDGQSHDIRTSPDTCLWTLIVRDSALTSAVHLPICSGRQRDSQLYLSIGHRLSIHVEQSEVRLERPGKAGTPVPTNSASSRRSGFLLTYECGYHCTAIYHCQM